MGAFNSLLARMECPGCGQVAEREVQFRYGEVWQHRYYVGSRLTWGANQEGSPEWDAATVPGYLLACSACGNEGDLNVVIIDSRVVGISRRIRDEGRDGPDAFATG